VKKVQNRNKNKRMMGVKEATVVGNKRKTRLMQEVK